MSIRDNVKWHLHKLELIHKSFPALHNLHIHISYLKLYITK